MKQHVFNQLKNSVSLSTLSVFSKPLNHDHDVMPKTSSAKIVQHQDLVHISFVFGLFPLQTQHLLVYLFTSLPFSLNNTFD